MILWFASNACRYLSGAFPKRLIRYVIDTVASPVNRHVRIPQMFCKEAVMWKYLKHPNILPLIGATISPPQLVSEFMPAGDLSKYIGENPDTDRMGLVSGGPVMRSTIVPCSLQRLAIRDRGGPPLPTLP